MAVIEIPNLYDSGTAGGRARGRFAVIGEPIVAVDLINTVAAPGSPVADDLRPADRGAQAWWRIERARDRTWAGAHGLTRPDDVQARITRQHWALA
jgi:hypothetical protein